MTCHHPPHPDDDRLHGRGVSDRSTIATSDACALAVASLGVDGAAVVLMTSAPGPHLLVHATDQLAATLVELQQVLGEGPSLDAVTTGLPVDVPDLTGAPAMMRWPGLAREAHAAGARAVRTLPLQVSDTVFGVLELHHRRTPAARPELTYRARAAADTMARTVLRDLAGNDALTATPADPNPLIGRPELDQAAGMTSVHLGVSVPEALARLRAAAFSQDRPVLDLARDILTGTTRLDPG